MTYSRDYRSYPPAFQSLIERAYLAVVEVTLASEDEAKRLRQRLFSYLGALHRAADLAKKLSVAKMDEVAVENARALTVLDDQARQVRLKVTGATLQIGPRDLDPDNLLVLEALGKAPATFGEVPMSAEMQAMFAGAKE